MRLLSHLIISALLFSPLAFGDRITSGWIHTFPHDSPGAEFHYVGQDFEFNGITYYGDWPSLRSIPPDNVIRTYGYAADIGVGPAPTYRGRSYPLPMSFNVMESWPHTEFVVEGPEILINGPGTYTAPFTIRATFCGIVPPERRGPNGFYECDLLVYLNGGGTVSLFVDEWGGGLRVSSASYDFANIPEPSSIGLGVIGLVAVCAAKLRQRAQLR